MNLDSSLSERPNRGTNEAATRRHTATLESRQGRKQKVHSLIDKVTIEQFEARKEEFLALLHQKLRDGTYRPKPVTRVKIGKSDGGVRKLGIPAMMDRVCQQALVQRMEPIFEPLFLDCSFGYRKGRSPHDAMRKVWAELGAGDPWVVDADLGVGCGKGRNDTLSVEGPLSVVGRSFLHKAFPTNTSLSRRAAMRPHDPSFHGRHSR